MHALTPRHRRKAGSGPPATALIAWIGIDPYLRDAATTVSHRRELDLPLLSDTRAAKAVAACFVLACAAVMGITEIVSHGRAEAQAAAGSGSLPIPSAAPVAVVPMIGQHPARRPGSSRGSLPGSRSAVDRPEQCH